MKIISFLLIYIQIGFIIYIAMLLLYLIGRALSRTEKQRKDINKFANLTLFFYILFAWPHSLYIINKRVRDKIREKGKEEEQIKKTSDFHDRLEKAAREKGLKDD